MSILEDNRVIAEYLGYKIANKQEELRATFAKRYALSENSLIVIAPKKGDPNTGSVTIFDPSSDWNQLMEAYKRIAQDRSVRIKMACGYTLLPFCSINTVDVRGITIYRENADLQAAVYQAVLEYIKKEESK